MFASPDSKTDTYKFSGLFYVSIMIILLEIVKKWVTNIPKTLFTYSGTKIELKLSGKTRYFSKENKAQIPNFVLIGIIWAASMTLKMTSPTIYLFIFNLKYVVQTFL